MTIIHPLYCLQICSEVVCKWFHLDKLLLLLYMYDDTHTHPKKGEYPNDYAPVTLIPTPHLLNFFYSSSSNSDHIVCYV